MTFGRVDIGALCLRKVEGLSYEDVRVKLLDAGVHYRAWRQPGAFPPYFRNSDFDVPSKEYQRARDALGRPVGEEEGLSMAYQCLWEVQPGFDWSILDGDVRFSRGRLVERVTLWVTEARQR